MERSLERVERLLLPPDALQRRALAPVRPRPFRAKLDALLRHCKSIVPPLLVRECRTAIREERCPQLDIRCVCQPVLIKAHRLCEALVFDALVSSMQQLLRLRFCWKGKLHRDAHPRIS